MPPSTVRDAFVHAQHDPCAIMFGFHLLITNHFKPFVVQCVSGVLGIIFASLSVSSQAFYEARCCYPVYPPSAAIFTNYGACNDPVSLIASARGAHCIHKIPTSQTVYLTLAIILLFLDALVYLNTYKLYLRTIDDALHRQDHRNLTRCIMLFPVTGILFGTYERVTRFSVIFYIRTFLLISGTFTAVYIYVDFTLNYAWGCYPSFQYGDNDGGKLTDLRFGRCDNPESPIYAWTDGHFHVWTAPFVSLLVVTFVWIVWIALYIVRWTGWRGFILSLPDEFYELTLRHTKR